MPIPEILAWTLLFASSIAALAALLAAVQARYSRHRSKQSAGQLESDRCLGNLQQLATTLQKMSREQIFLQLRNLQRRVQALGSRNGTAAILDYLLDVPPSHFNDSQAVLSGVRGVVAAELRRLERGGQRLCGYLIKVGPWAGLTGTLVGVRGSLAAFVKNVAAVQEFAAGFATAIDTTVWGVLIAVAAFTTSRWLWGPIVEGLSSELVDNATTAFNSLKRIYHHLDDDGIATPHSDRNPNSPPGNLQRSSEPVIHSPINGEQIVCPIPTPT